MTTLISALSLSLDTNHGLLFENLSFTLHLGDRIGLIGHNGCGKSTLLALLSGTLEPDSGSLHQARACRLQHVEQHLPSELAGRTVREVLAAAAPERAWHVDAMLEELGIGPTADKPIATLSGGQHTRVLLGRALLHEPNLLLLDEPSNHLDLPSLLWLERFLSSWQGAFVLVSHDQRLLDAVTRKTWILRDRRIHDVDMACGAARVALAEQDHAAATRHAAEQKEIDRLAASSHRLAIWGKTYDNEGLARKAKSIQKRVERLKDEQSIVSQGSPWELALHGTRLAADQLLSLNEIAVSPAPDLPPLFRTGCHAMRAGDRVALIGMNGAGKSSLLRQCWAAYRQDAPIAGLKLHDAARVGYYDQGLRQLDGKATLADALYPFAPDHARNERMLRQALISAGFAYARHAQAVDTLSGGERARLLFLALSLASYHLLLLDEPTNHLDLDGKEELATALRDYEGGCILVSHDRKLLEHACNRFWVVRDGRLEEWQDAGDAFASLGPAATVPGTPLPATSVCPRPRIEVDDVDALLIKLCELERLLSEDLARKPRDQKPARQLAWRAEIAALSDQLKHH